VSARSTIAVTVAWATRDVQEVVPLRLPRGATVADAVAASGLVARHAIDPATIGCAIYGRLAADTAELADGDRVELTRPLGIEPKAARRLRAEVKAARAGRR
jgi:putative ubiquitin-RnfH superfamily antitoxin RatB of RatAB toxin-antitoxin module